MKILLAEDDPRDAELSLRELQAHLEPSDVFHVNNGEEALDFLLRRGSHSNRAGGNPLLVLLDLKMPMIDGLEVLQAIRESPFLCHVPVVILTSSREPGDLRKAYELGANAYVVKPMDFKSYREAVGKTVAFWMTLNELPPGGPTDS